MSGNESLFTFIDKTFKSEIKMGNNETIPIVGKGSIMVRTKQGEKKEIQNVYFASSTKHTLMSVGQLIQISLHQRVGGEWGYQNRILQF